MELEVEYLKEYIDYKNRTLDRLNELEVLLKSRVVCVRCTGLFVKKQGFQKYCDKCKLIRINLREAKKQRADLMRVWRPKIDNMPPKKQELLHKLNSIIIKEESR